MSGRTRFDFEANQGANTAMPNPHSALPLQTRIHPYPQKNVFAKSPSGGSQTIDSIDVYTQMSVRNELSRPPPV